MDRKRSFFWLNAVFILVLGAPLHAADLDDDNVAAEQHAIDKDTSLTDAQKTDALTKQFNVPSSSVQDLRSKGQGWGEITIGLASAQKLSSMDPKTPLLDALTKIEAMRASGEGWGKIARDLGFKLGPVVSEAHHARRDMNKSLHAEKIEHEHPHHERPEHPGHPDRPERPGH